MTWKLVTLDEKFPLFLASDSALTIKLTRQQRRVDTVKLKIWNHQKRQRENNNELQDN